MTILFFAAIFAGLFVEWGDHYFSAGILVLGVFIGSASWWLVLSGFTGLLHGLFNFRRMQWLNRISGLIIIGLASRIFKSCEMRGNPSLGVVMAGDPAGILPVGREALASY
jgi:threonine/homoserine/homoserine lactone efflux protein